MTSRFDSSAATPQPPKGFTLTESNEHWLNDFELYEGPERTNRLARINLTTTWDPQDGTRIFVDTPPASALSLDQARWLAAALPELLEELGAAA